MALFRDDAGKTEKPTPGRLNDAREKGQVALSRELTMSGTLLVAVLALEYGGKWLIDALGAAMRHGLNVDLREHRIGEGGHDGYVQEILWFVLCVMPPVAMLMLLGVVATCLFGYGQIGFRVTPQTLAWKPERLNPATNLGKLMSFSSVMKTVVSAAKLAALGLVLWLVLRSRAATLAHLHQIDDLAIGIGIVLDLAFAVFFWIAVVVLLLSLGDVLWQRFDHNRSLMMTKQEVEDERKRADGDPLMKSRLRGARLEIMRQRMMEAIPKADVVITNPTHFAVALRYDRSKHRAPAVVAKGVDELAAKIRELAREHDVPVLEDPPLARALWRAVRVGQEVPARFYQAVATVLGHVYRLKNKVA